MVEGIESMVEPNLLLFCLFLDALISFAMILVDFIYIATEPTSQSQISVSMKQTLTRLFQYRGRLTIQYCNQMQMFPHFLKVSFHIIPIVDIFASTLKTKKNIK